MKNSKICMIGTFPPPVHGMALVNDAIKKNIISLDLQPIIIDLSAASLSRALYSRLFRIRKMLGGLITFIKTIGFDGGGTLYLGISGGIGQIYELPFICIGRLYGKDIFIHHHSYAYLYKKNFIVKLLTLLAGPKSIHIVACEDMGKRLKALYSCVLNIAILSGIVTVDRCIYSNQSGKECLKTIGFISNISIEKGILDFLDVVSCLEKVDEKISALIAGPFQDKRIETLVMNRISKLKTAKYVGPKYGKEKSAFYDNIDVLLFPTNYINESEGLVIHEAMSHRVPVIAKARGCIESIIQSNSGLAIKYGENFVKFTVERLLSWRSSPHEFQQSSLSAFQTFSLYRDSEEKKLEKLCAKIVRS